MNDGHTHPDIGMFWMYARGKYLAIDTGYLYNKRSLDHNTILIDGKGMANDGSYWVYRGRSYGTLNQARIRQQYMENSHAYARGDFSTVYTDIAGTYSIQRSVLMAKDYLIVLDDLSSNGTHTYSWLLHTEQAITQNGNVFSSQNGTTLLKVHSLAPTAVTASMGVHSLTRGSPPGNPVPENFGYLLRLDNTAPVAKTSFLNVLVPAASGETAPVITTWEVDGTKAGIQVKGNGYTDYFAASLGDTGTKTVTNPQDSQESVTWTGAYTFIRVAGTEIIVSGSVSASKLKVTGITSARLNGEATGFTTQAGYTGFPGPLPVKDNRKGLVPENNKYQLQLQPNPFKDNVAISYQLTSDTPAATTITIFDLDGNTIKNLDINDLTMGTVTWDGSDKTGHKVPAGIYLCRLQSGDTVMVRPVICNQI
jgi:hypothetical protein